MKVIKIIAGVTAVLICGFLLYTFLFTMSLNQINHGNVTGCIFCVTVILLVCFYPLLRKNKPLKTAVIVLGALLGVFAIYCAVISALIASEMLHGEDKAVAVSAIDGGTPQTVIILGCKTIDGYPSTMLELRLIKGIEYLDAHPEAVCIVTGGQGADEIEPEAVSMRRYLTGHGIADERIYTEPDSTNTEENIKNSVGIIFREDLPENVVIVSECYHIYRGVRQARRAGFTASGIYPDPSPVLITMPSYWLREIIAITRDLVVDIFP
ncbi:MAG: YdcF family protein [Ruminiclostridium sp.]|nr:YdcF family protein [Ruminiclostridium sp.]